MSCFPWHTSHAMHVSSAGPRWGAVIGLEWFHTDIWAFLSLGFLTPSLSVFFGRKRAVLKRRGRSEGFSVYVCDEGQSHEKECVNYYSLNSRLNEERLTWWKPVNILRGRWRRAEEMKQNIQCDLICEHNFEAVFVIIERALSLCLALLHSQPWQVKINTELVWRQLPFSLILHELLFRDILFLWVRVWHRIF